MRLSILFVLLACGDDAAPLDDAGARPDARGRDGGTVSDAGGDVDGGAPIRGRGCPADLKPDPLVDQALPSIDLDTSYPAATGRTIAVAAGGDLQAAIDEAMPGDVIEIDPAGTYTGPFQLREKTGDGWIVIRTATPDAMLPPPGSRIGPAHAALLPDLIVGEGAGGVFQTEARAHHYRLAGLEIAPAPGEFVYALVELGGGESSLDEMPHHLVLDRVYMRAEPALGTRRAVALNCGAAAVIDSYLEGFFHEGYDSQAIAGWAGPGPYRIANNYLEGASENVIFGGADPSIADVVPSDIEVCGNHFTKPVEWIGMRRNVKNLFELKNARRVLVAGNVFENVWADGQVGFALVLTPRNQDGSAPWSTIEDVTIARNVIRNAAGGINLLGEDDNHPSLQQARVVVRDNFIDVDNEAFDGVGRAIQIITPDRPVIGLVIAHNTIRIRGNSAVTVGDGGPVAMDFHFLDNVVEHGTYGFFGGGQGEGNAALMHYTPDVSFRRNVLIGYAESRYPADNFFPADDAAVGFAGPADYRLSPSSPFAGMATDGSDPGADFDRLDAAIEGVTGGP